VNRAREPIDVAFVEATVARSLRRFDKGGEAFYDQISALHKAVRGTNPDAALYWMCRMLDGGADPLYVGRRLIRMASEDIGLADPRALPLATAAVETFERLGSPEGELALAEAVLYLACAAKSNAVYMAYNAAREFIAKDGSRPVPAAAAQRADPDDEGAGLRQGLSLRARRGRRLRRGERYFPDNMPDVTFYEPTERGLEAKIREKLDALRARDREADSSQG
jgi:putative ATPase